MWQRRLTPSKQKAWGEKEKNGIDFFEIWEKRVCDIWEKGRWREKKIDLNSEIWEKGVCDIWEKWGWRERKFVFFELKSEIWQKGVCDIWEKWVCLGVRKGDP